jgi:hypothetical protein
VFTFQKIWSAMKITEGERKKLLINEKREKIKM